MDRIVVTGMGLVSPLGTGVEIAWKRLLAGGSGLRLLGEDIVGDLAAKVGGVVPDIGEDAEGG
ncbi:beta-ketoacyl synthase N-terminal-like domain-containing protein, partial [Paraburkholderia sp. SIMBA_027]|uniref:beta-ketoacyl synthase N-terminal-like domain-containing protein n=1 Tax=Paraburkholderia sp. SIMBA_027 TaxID=3085770 RepID=UPI00397BC96D